MFCNKCGTQLEEGLKFCYKCGTPVKQDLESVTEKNDKEHVKSLADHVSLEEQTHPKKLSQTKKKHNKKKFSLKVLMACLLIMVVGAGTLLYQMFGTGFSKTLKAYVKFAKEYDKKDKATHSYVVGLDASNHPYLIVNSYDDDENEMMFKSSVLYTYKKGKVMKLKDWNTDSIAYSDGIIIIYNPEGNNGYQINDGEMQKIYGEKGDELTLYCGSEKTTFDTENMDVEAYRSKLKDCAKEWYKYQDVDVELLDYVSELGDVNYKNAFLSFPISRSDGRSYIYSAKDLEGFVDILRKKSAKTQDSFMQATYDYHYGTMNEQSEEDDVLTYNLTGWSEYGIYRNNDILLEMDCTNDLELTDEDLCGFLGKGNIEIIKNQKVTSVDLTNMDWSWKYDIEWLGKKGVVDAEKILAEEQDEFSTNSSIANVMIRNRKENITNKDLFSSLNELIKEQDRITAGKETFESYSQKYACEQCGAIKECVDMAYVCSNQACEKYEDDRKRKTMDPDKLEKIYDEYSELYDYDNVADKTFETDSEYLDSLDTEYISCGDKTVSFKVKEGFERDQEEDVFSDDSSQMVFFNENLTEVVTVYLYKEESTMPELEEALKAQLNWEYNTGECSIGTEDSDLSGIYTYWYDDLIETDSLKTSFMALTKIDGYVYAITAYDDSGMCYLTYRPHEYLAPFLRVKEEDYPVEEEVMEENDDYSDYDMTTWEGARDYLLSGITLGEIPQDDLYIMDICHDESLGIDTVSIEFHGFLYKCELTETDLSAYEDDVNEGYYEDILDMIIWNVYEMDFG